ncbi:MAG: response regulator [Archangiaceae bacterium]|nr:response regulator [Archangiaceae bacterium]
MSDPVKFLLVDDIEENLIALEGLLQRDGLELWKAKSGREALELLLVHDFALALLDVQMPEMNGFELAELMRGTERSKHVPIIFLTAGSRDPNRMFKGYDSGAVDFLFKPVDARVLESKAKVFFDLYRQKHELANALRLNEMFVGILGHDLRNPLSAMITGVQVLKRQLEGQPQQKSLDRMQQAGARMTEMIDQMLDLTRARLADGLGFARRRQELDVAALARRASDELKVSNPERDVVFDVEGDAHTLGDPDRLLQLFSNLMANAFTHGEKSAPVKVTVRGGPDAVITEVGNGGVIPAEMLPSLFDPFRTRRKNSPTKGDGLGLGLYITQQIAAAHGGVVTVESTAAAGTRFKVWLPRRNTDSKPKPAVAAPRSVLIVDDDRDVREALAEAFVNEGYAAREASDGQVALDMMQKGEQRPDVVILDMVLPVVDGRRVYQAMQADPALKTIPVIVSTSTPLGAPPGTVVIPKPLRLDRLLDAVAELWR